MRRCPVCLLDKPNCEMCLVNHDLKEKPKKPPLGVPPRKIWNLTRIKDITRAIEDYTKAGLAIDPEWIKEYNELIVEVSKR